MAPMAPMAVPRLIILAACLAAALAGVAKSKSTTTTTTTTPRNDNDRLPEDVLCELFGGAHCDKISEMKIAAPSDTCPCLDGSSEVCKCIPYYECDSAMRSSDHIDIHVPVRQTCSNYLHMCCKVPQAKPSAPPTKPTKAV